jgi:hypothetical protein
VGFEVPIVGAPALTYQMLDLKLNFHFADSMLRYIGLKE